MATHANLATDRDSSLNFQPHMPSAGTEHAVVSSFGNDQQEKWIFQGI